MRVGALWETPILDEGIVVAMVDAMREYEAGDIERHPIAPARMRVDGQRAAAVGSGKRRLSDRQFAGRRPR